MAHADPLPQPQGLFPGPSEMAGRMRAFDWAASALGPTSGWPDNLRSAVRLCLTSRFPICLWWGPDLLFLYNDAYLPWLTEVKHPRALMQHGRDVWPELWPTIGPMLADVAATGRATLSEDMELYLNRKLVQEEAYFTFSYSPILDADGRAVDGIFCPVWETTDKMVGARRLETLRRLSPRTAKVSGVETACAEAVAVMADNPRDIPFVAIYVAGDAGDEVRLAASHLPRGAPPLPVTVRTPDDDGNAAWPLAWGLRAHRAREHADIDLRDATVPTGAWPDHVRKALVLPIRAPQEQLAGLLLVGASPRRPLDAAYRTFFDLVAGHVATAIGDAKAHEAARRRAEALAELDRAKTAFFSNVSHEFRTPLTLMLGPVRDMLSLAGDPVPVDREELALIHRNGLRLLKLVNALLDFSRIEAGRMQPRLRPVDLGALTAELASTFRATIEKAGMRLNVDCPPLPGPVLVDRDMWEKIVLNLVSNAFKFTFEGSIGIALRRRGDHVELEVSDTGIGIAEADLPQLFERFHRIEGARGRTHEGSGIGLALVRELARLHGGDIAVQSHPGQGSVFTVSVANRPAPQAVTAAGAEASTVATGPNAFVAEASRWLPDDDAQAAGGVREAPTGVLRILFADDNADLRLYVQRLLGPPHHHVQVVADGEAALISARRDPPDLVLADIMMPRLDGLGLLKALRADARTRRVPVILLSARAGEERTVDGLTAGANDYLVKPFSAGELLARVDAALATAGANRQALDHEHALRRSAEESELRSKGALAAELEETRRLHALGTRLLSSDGLQPLLEEVLGAAIELLGADAGSIQLADPETGELRTAALRSPPARDGLVAEVRATPLLGSDGQTLGMLSTRFSEACQPSDHGLRFLDQYARLGAQFIERRRAEEALRISEERFRRYFEIGLIGAALTSPTRGILEVNEELCRILGYSREELLARSWAEMTHPDDLAADVAKFERVMAGDADGYTLDKRWIRKDGTVIHSIMAARCVRRADGSVDFFVGLVQDITERKLAADALAQRERHFRLLLDSIPHHVWSFSPAADPGTPAVSYWNKQLFDYTGLTEEQSRAGGWEALHPGDVERVRDAWQTALHSGSSLEIEQRVRGRDGRYRRFVCRGVPVRYMEGRPVEWFGTDTDVEDLRQAEEALQRSRAEMAHVARVTTLGQLAASIAHEVNQPLAAVGANGHAGLRWLDARPPNLDEARAAIGRMMRDGNRAADVILRIRQFLRRGDGKPVAVDIVRLIVDVLTIVQGELRARGVVQRLAPAEGGLPAVSADPVQVRQVVLNLILNAIEAMRPVPEPQRRLDIAVAREGAEALRVCVRDAGIGLAPEDRERAFEAFHTTKPDGMGMGLAIARSIVEAHGGRLWATANEDGPGETFQFTLPLAPG